MASDFEYTTSDRVGERLRTTFDGSSTPTAAVVDEIISEAEATINKYAGRAFTQATYTNELYDHNGADFITVKNPDLQSVSSIEYSTDGGDSWTALSSSDYVVYTDFDRIERNRYKATDWVPAGFQNLRITYDAGPSSVPVHIRSLATDMAVAEVIRSVIGKSANTEGGRISVGSISIDDPAMFSVNYLSALDSSIMSRLAKLAEGRVRTTIGKRWD